MADRGPTNFLDETCDTTVIANAKFYLSFENTLCDQYVTEKFFKRMAHPILPVVMAKWASNIETCNFSSCHPSSAPIFSCAQGKLVPDSPAPLLCERGWFCQPKRAGRALGLPWLKPCCLPLLLLVERSLRGAEAPHHSSPVCALPEAAWHVTPAQDRWSEEVVVGPGSLPGIRKEIQCLMFCRQLFSLLWYMCNVCVFIFVIMWQYCKIACNYRQESKRQILIQRGDYTVWPDRTLKIFLIFTLPHEFI